MKTVVIFASPRKNGYTKKLLDMFLKRCNGEYEIIGICDIDFKPCFACGKCRDKSGKCLYDDLDVIFEKIENADRVIIASPVYNYSLPSQMKAFADRLQPYFEAGLKNTLPGKRGFLLSSCGCSGKFSVEVMHRQCEMIFKELGFDFYGEYFKINTDNSDITTEDEKEIITIAENYFNRD